MISNPNQIVGAIGLIILYLVIIAETGEIQKKCVRKNGNFPIPGSLCKSYFICKNFRVIGEVSCKSDEHFNDIKGWCDSKHLFPCLDKPKSKKCLRDNGRFLKSGTGCVWYFDCCNGEAKEKRCEKGKLFDKYLEKCVSSRRVACKETETSKESTSSESTSDESSEESGSKEFFSTTSINDKVSTSFQPKFSTVTDIFRMSTSIGVLSTTTDEASKDSTLQELSSSHQTSESDSVDITFEPTSEDLTSKDSSIISQTTYNITTESIFKITSDSLPEKTSSNPNSISPDVSTEISSEATSTDFEPEVSHSSIHTTQSTRSSSSEELTTEEILPSSTIGSSPSSIYTTYFTRPETTKSRTIREVLSTKTVTEDLSTLDPEIADFVCPEPTGYFPHPTDKHKFIGCVHNRPSVLTCPSKLIYNHKYRRCLYQV